jgi:Cu(I)/Ag(I) efflux system membrane fusion protein
MNTHTQANHRKYLIVFVLLLLSATGLWLWQSRNASNNDALMDTGTREFYPAGPLGIAVSLSPTTPRVGENTITIQVRNREQQVIKQAKVRAVAQMPAMGAMPAMHAQADIRELGDGIYRGEFDLTMAGEWPMAIDVETTDGQHVDLTFDLATGRPGLTLATATPVGDIAYHTCSMHPSVKSATPGTCPICSMGLVPVLKSEIKSGVITVDEKRRQLIGVTTADVETTSFSVPVVLQGQLQMNTTAVTDINLRFDGWIGELHADYEGKLFKSGDALFTVYSPELLTLQEEYLETWRRRNSDSDSRLRAAHQRLLLWGLTAQQVEWLQEQGRAQDYVPILAQQDGVVVSKHIVNGSGFKAGENVLRIADLSTLWLEAYAYERDLSLLQASMTAEVDFVNTLQEPVSATLWQINPYLNANTRTALVRFVIDNKDHKLKPGLFAKATVQADLGEQLTVPTDAIIISGDKRVVFIDLGEGKLQPRTVQTGYSSGDNTIIVEGLEAGERIVTSGNFLIAAESKLKSGLQQW